MTDPKRPEDADELQPAESGVVDEVATEPVEDVETEVVYAADDEEERADEGALADEGDELDVDEHRRIEETMEADYALTGETPIVSAPSTPTAARDKAARTGAPISAADDLPYIDDRVSKWWVGLIVATFALILAYGLLFGRGGVLTPVPTAEPTDSPAPSLSISPSPLRTPAPSGTAGPSGTPGTSPSAAPSNTSSAPTAAPSAAPSAAPTAGPT